MVAIHADRVAIAGLGILWCISMEWSSAAYSLPPTHSNFLKSQYEKRPGRSQYVWCGRNASICLDPDRNPSGPSTCCWSRLCKNTNYDSNHCGTCGRACGYALNCCGGMCVDLNSNTDHCGSCHKQCPGEQICSFGMCDYGAG